MLNQAVIDGRLYNFPQILVRIYYRSLCKFEVNPQAKVISGNKIWGEGLERYVTDSIFFTQEPSEAVQGNSLPFVYLQSMADTYDFRKLSLHASKCLISVSSSEDIS